MQFVIFLSILSASSGARTKRENQNNLFEAAEGDHDSSMFLCRRVIEGLCKANGNYDLVKVYPVLTISMAIFLICFSERQP